MAILKFQTNIPVEVRLRSIEGEPVESQFGIQYKFTPAEGMFYVSDVVGAILMEQFRKLNVKPGVPRDHQGRGLQGPGPQGHPVDGPGDRLCAGRGAGRGGGQG
jgi:hypothetical protein